MNNDLKEYIKKYKPTTITTKKQCFILKTMTGDYVIKPKDKINYQFLYNYLYSRKFNYLPKIIEENNQYIIFEYQEDIKIDTYEKSFNLIRLLSLLHSKTSYYKNTSQETYKEIYDTLNNNIIYLENYYNQLFDKYIESQIITPHKYLFLTNYSIIYTAIKYTKEELYSWYLNIKEKDKIRVVLNNNNLELDHYIKNEKEYIISWENYKIDTPIVDLLGLYKKEWSKITFDKLIDEYNKLNKLNDYETQLLLILISIPYKIDITNKEIDNCRNMRLLIEYLKTSSNIITNMTTKV